MTQLRYLKGCKPDKNMDAQIFGQILLTNEPLGRGGNLCRHFHKLGTGLRRLLKLAFLAVDDRCTYCQKPLNLRGASLDHVLPTCRGGSDFRSNLVLSCKPCNTKKGHKLLEQTTLVKRR